MKLFALAFATMTASQAQNATQLERALNRISEEAEVFARQAPLMISEETLHQKALRRQTRFRPRIGADALKPPEPVYQDRTLICEYGFGTLKDSPGVVRELRRVVSVDDKKLESSEKARETLTLGLKSDNDRAKKKLIQDFEKNGLIGAAIDFGQLLLQFRHRNLAKYKFEMRGTTRSGPDTVTIIAFEQQDGPGAMTLYRGNSAQRVELTGEIWVRANDFLPLRILINTERRDGDVITRHLASVDYQLTPFGVLAPAAVKHQEFINRVLKTENLYQYTSFRKFAASAEIKFTELPETPQ